ncbi:MAG: hypothetical protein EKK37_00795 [Sphingobacteriales bacterium]|nr:MAG: hypothetical protein EKK37_00795 [Sphingobacteriales bacterium]
MSLLNTATHTDFTKIILRYLGKEVTLYNPLCRVSQQKNILKTAIEGRDGTIKEFVGMGDYEIEISGTIDGANGVYPQDEVFVLKRMLDVNDATIPIQIINQFLNTLDIYSIVIESYNLPQAPGGISYQLYSINAISTAPIELQVV